MFKKLVLSFIRKILIRIESLHLRTKPSSAFNFLEHFSPGYPERKKFILEFRNNQRKCCRPIHRNSYFYDCTCEKTCSAVHFTIGKFFVNLPTEKLWVQRHDVLCLLEIQTRLLFFFLA